MKSPGMPLPTYQKSNNINPPECVVGGALAYVLRASRRAGAAALTVGAAGAGWRVAPSPVRAVFQCIVLAIFEIIGLSAVILDFLEEPKKHLRIGDSAITVFLWLFDLILAMAISSFAIYSEPARMERLLRTLKRLNQINIDLHNDPSTKTEKIKTIAFICVSTWFIALQATEFFMHTLEAKNRGDNWLIMVMYGSFYAMNMQTVMVAHQWGCAVLAVRAAAAALNRHLGRLRYVNLKSESAAREKGPPMFVVDWFTEMQQDVTHPGSEIPVTSSELQITIRRLALSHEDIGELMREMDDANGAIVLLVVMATFLRLVVTPYHILLGFYSNDGIVISLQLCWAVLHLSTLLVAVEPCQRTHEQRETTKFLLGQLLVHLGPKCKRLSEELEQFAMKIRLTDVKFTPLGVYVLSRPLIATVLGGATTYLIIILQFMSATRHFDE